MGLVLALLLGGFWGALWLIIFAVSFMLVSGQLIDLNLTPALIAGSAAAAMWLGWPRQQRSRSAQLALVIVWLSLLLLLSNAQPFGLPWQQNPWAQVSCLLLMTLSAAVSLCLILGDCAPGKLNRYQVEVLMVRALKAFGLVFFLSIVLLPFYVMLMTSVKSQQQLLANPLDYSVNLAQGLDALLVSYIELFRDYHFGAFMFNSLVVSVATVVLTLLFAIPGAYAVARLRFPGNVTLSRSILLIYMIPAIVLVIPLYSLFSQLGLRNSLLGLIIVYPATTIPVALYMLQGYFRSIPAELEEAGLMDGLRRLGVIVQITLPLSLPALASVALYVFMIAWNEFLFAFMFLDNIDIFTLSRGIVSLNSSEVPRQHLMAGAVITTIPVLVLFLWFERFLVSGLTAGSVKG